MLGIGFHLVQNNTATISPVSITDTGTVPETGTYVMITGTIDTGSLETDLVVTGVLIT
jgi:hypothetical protein